MMLARKLRESSSTTALLSLQRNENNNNNSKKSYRVYIVVQKSCNLLMMWTGFSILVFCVVSWYACGNLQGDEKSIEHDTVLVANVTEEASPKQLDDIENKELKKQIIELTNPLPEVEQEDENEDENYMFKPTIAPATPQIFLQPSSVSETPSILSILTQSPPSPASSSMVSEVSPTTSTTTILKATVVTKDNIATDENSKSSSGGDAPPSSSNSLPPHVAIKKDGKIEDPSVDKQPSILEEEKSSSIETDKDDENENQDLIREEKKDKISEQQAKINSEQPQVKDGKDTALPTNQVPVTSPPPLTTPTPITNQAPQIPVEKGSDVKIKILEGGTPKETTDSESDLKNDAGKMMSFTEWKQKHDREKEIKKEKEESEEEVEEIVQKSPQGTVIKTVVVTKKKNKKKKKNLSKNYASPNCGGKVIAANAEAQNSNAILKEDKDVYMLNPCNVQAWAVIELCDRVQLYSIDFANFEMFSSTPEVFAVHVSNRYPTRDWVKVQEFEAKPGREVQTFHIKEKFYAKYIKFEVLKYIGKEHYCPLSLLRVFGVTEVEEFENDENDDSNTEDEHDVTHSHSSSSTASSKDEKTEDSGIFESAKQAVVGLVSNVAKTFTGHNENEQNDASNNNDKPTNPNVSEIVTLMSHGDHHRHGIMEYFEDSSFLTTCIQRTMHSEYNASFNPICNFGLTYMLIKRMCPTMTLYHAMKTRDYLLSKHHKKIMKGGNEKIRPIPPPPLKAVVVDINTEPINDKLNNKFAASVNIPTTSNNQEVAKKGIKKIETTNSIEDKPHESEKSNVIVGARDIATTASPSPTSDDSTCSTKQKPSIDITKLVKSVAHPHPSFTDLKVVASSSSVTKALEVIGTPPDIVSTSSPDQIDPSVVVVKIETTSLATTKQQDSVDVLEFKVNHTDTTSVVAEKVMSHHQEEKEVPATVPDTEESSKVKDDLVVKDEKVTENVVKPSSTTNATEEKVKETITEEKPVEPLVVSETKDSSKDKGDKKLQPTNEESQTTTVDHATVGTASMETTTTKPDANIKDDGAEAKTESPTETSTSTTTTTTPTPPTVTTTTTSPNTAAPENEVPTQPPSSSKTSKPVVPASQPQPPVMGLSGSKESIVVKLGGKIKALQENLTMSMMYLEEMSERYRTAVEEVDKRHEKKSFALNVNLKSQQDIIQHQSVVIQNLSKTVELLTSKIENVTETFQKQHEIMTEKHVFWVFMEIILVVTILLFCGRRVPANQPPPTHEVNGGVQVNRRKSEPALSHADKNGFVATTKKKRSHSTAEAVFRPHSTAKNDIIQASLEEIEMEASKRKKRKKQINLSPKPETIKETRLSKTAGLLFYAGKGILSGLTGAFYYGTEKSKPSRRADALIDTIHKPSASKKDKMLRRARSIDLPTVIEEVSAATHLQLTPVSRHSPLQSSPTSDHPPMERPKSADSIFYNGPTKKSRSKIHQKTVGRFA